MKGRFIGQNKRLIKDMLEQTKLQEIPGILFLLDFRKAFDTIEWTFIQQTIDRINLLLQHRKLFTKQWLRNILLLTVERSASGMPSLPLPLHTRGGEIRYDRTIEGIKLFSVEHKISQFTDDTSLFLKEYNFCRYKSKKCDQLL